ncbi:3-dehydroquinate synthase [candidate division WOR-1 bacterium RIFOXYA12_FULL_43_27]|uniref:3-dehydroquinate synthase n=1 Tax=candidate division WOR-1 bacterium RIFOXYC2_FULL_46_14 TaxID=1802587 RepID=A0A1F4U5L9_UNCSA|nr:MAG: 3-dehydroquinate synthase [candidate division WOR-1 bacterium RIFOXYA12_FULL_43_27]OGC20390.1 MAG: 3-dehydroquinate synthase [candidate division WOR-1 bacterium RIFOXYB2_FULL_46_45]OGC31873.1 MAG: 3-dehydroquinate synthase [candidate division WOR-1 bacterium RIFOXYA2_FULL_46_56]OGC40236.1 MAG: 3-dehydroquinate synthase [candidate division WOR-1 bacterium RIFOXYC2_FULL_46_14]
MDKKIRVELGERGYDIVIGSKILEKIPGVIISDPLVYKLYRSRVKGLGARVILIPRGERYKTVAMVEKIWDKLAEWKISRDDTIVALGGGVVGDIAGFAAATYMRGINLIQVPTTLLAQVDSSIGGKTGVDHSKGKNLIGAFYQPSKVIIDTDTLKTLPEKELRNGMAEVIKYGVIQSPYLFELLESGRMEMEKIIFECARIKAEVVAGDERETGGGRMILNFGHTIGHAIETLSKYRKISHGEAVAIGMVAASVIAVKAGMLDPDFLERIWKLVDKFKLPTYVKGIPARKILEAIKLDKKVRGGKIKLVLPTAIGSVEIRDDIPPQKIAEALNEFICK